MRRTQRGDRMIDPLASTGARRPIDLEVGIFWGFVYSVSRTERRRGRLRLKSASRPSMNIGRALDSPGRENNESVKAGAPGSL
jgi:hypothetical protein